MKFVAASSPRAVIVPLITIVIAVTIGWLGALIVTIFTGNTGQEVALRPPGMPRPLMMGVMEANPGDGSLDTIAPSSSSEKAARYSDESEWRLAWFRYDLRAFAADLESTGRVAPARARYLSYVAVSEAYRQGIPPALVFGVMSIENSAYRSDARSSVGAVGLMQIMPRFWLESLGRHYGYDLEDDATNLRMGIHILAHYAAEADGDWSRALLRYNGCVHGTNTPNCHSYPTLVRRSVERRARYSCPTHRFDECVALPLAYRFAPEPSQLSVAGSTGRAVGG